MKKSSSIEMKIYELLGIKIFKKIVFILWYKSLLPLTIEIPKEERKKFIHRFASNYNLGKLKSIEDVKKFKRCLLLNASIHMLGLSVCYPKFLEVIAGTTDLFGVIINLTWIAINLYCIMLQRYNEIRIDQFVKRVDQRKEKIKQELINKDSLLEQHTYKIIDNNKNETKITFEGLIENATIEQLKQYRLYLLYFKIIQLKIKENNLYDWQKDGITIPMEDNKVLKLELTNNK